MSAILFDNFVFFVSQNQLATYLITFFSIIFLGNVGAFVGFWLALSGGLGKWGAILMIAVAFLADITADILWYSLGHLLRDTRFGVFIKNHLPYHKKIEANFQKKYKHWIFLAKFILFSNFAAIFLAGWTKIKFSKLLKISFLALLAWEPFLLLLTYALTSSLTPLGAALAFKKFEYLLSAGIISFLIFHYLIIRLFSRFFRKFLIEKEVNEEEKRVNY